MRLHFIDYKITSAWCMLYLLCSQISGHLIIASVRAPLGAGESQPEKNWAGARVVGWRSQPACRLPAGEGLEQGWLAEPAGYQLQPNSPQAFVSAMMTESGEIYSKLNKFLNVSDTDFVKAPQSISEKCSTEY